MKIKKITANVLAVIMVFVITLSMGSYVRAEGSTGDNELPTMSTSMEADLSVKEDSACKRDAFMDIALPDMNNVMELDETASGHNTAGTALYLDSSYMGVALSDTANAYENWYFFNMEDKNKISVVLEQPSDGDYDIYLYQYHDDGTLTLVSYSIYSGTKMENISAVCESGYYFLRVVPDTAATAADAVYNFLITLIDQYDSCEPDDIPDFAVEYTDSINVKNTIDNTFDEDWSKMTITSSGTYIISMSDIPEGNTYNVYVYNASFDFLAGMSCDKNKVGTVSLSVGDYYICVASASGYSAVQNYNLKVVKRHTSASSTIFTKTGQIVELTSTALYINGAAVDMNWKYEFSGSSYNRRQYAKVTDSTTFALDTVMNGTYYGADNVSAQDCIAVQMKDFKYEYFYRAAGAGANYDYINEPIDVDSWFYVNAATGKVIDTEWNYFYWGLNRTRTFNEFK